MIKTKKVDSKKRQKTERSPQEKLSDWEREYFLTKVPVVIAANKKEISREDTPGKETDKFTVELLCQEYYRYRIIEQHLYTTRDDQERLHQILESHKSLYEAQGYRTDGEKLVEIPGILTRFRLKALFNTLKPK